MRYFDFIELDYFRNAWNNLGFNDDDLYRLELEWIEDPDTDAKLGHLWKKRFALKQSGKSGGARVGYVYVKTKNLIFLVFCFKKSAQENFSPEQKRILRDLAKKLHDEALSKDFLIKKRYRHEK